MNTGNILPNKTVILGSGIAGISAGYHLKQKGINATIYEKDGDWGGLCGNFIIDGFRFDRFVHFTFTDDPYIKGIFEKSSPLYEHPSTSYNYYHEVWLKHPVLNNLAPLSSDEKIKIIRDFVNRPQKDESEIKDYADWLRVKNGNYFAEHFPFVYTKKYWGQEPQNMEIKWIGKRIHSPDLCEVLRGAFETQNKNFYYTSVMRYPKKGGFRSILDVCRNGLDIQLNKKVIRINSVQKEVFFADGTSVKYGRLISTLPLPEIVKIIDSCPKAVRESAQKLHWTCGYQVSLGFNRPDVAKHLWFYIYDEDVPPARVYSPSLKSPDNVPEGCSSYQAEIFYDCQDKVPPAEKVLKKTVAKLKEICDFEDKDIVIQDIRFEPYANITFTQGIYEARQIILNYLKTIRIESIGRFGKWDYLWSHQAFEGGENVEC